MSAKRKENNRHAIDNVPQRQVCVVCHRLVVVRRAKIKRPGRWKEAMTSVVCSVFYGVVEQKTKMGL